MKKIIIFLISFLAISSFAQENIKKKVKNEIFFTEGSIGVFTYKSSGSMFFSASINYQNRKNIFTIRKIFLVSSPFSIGLEGHPSLEEELQEISFLYGRRYIKDDFSYSFSVGISKKSTFQLSQNPSKKEDISFYGIPLEINLRWFKPKKKRFRFLSIIPVGKATSFGFSSGFKFFSTISKKSYIGLSYIIGFGYYKNYH